MTAKNESILIEVADDMEMYANQIRESFNGGQLPSVWRLDDLIERYRAAVRKVIKASNTVA